MAGYLDRYGEGDERRSRIIKWIVLSAVTVLVVGGTLLFVFHNYRQEKQLKRFFTLLEQKDYQDAYQLWVRNDSDRKGYPFPSFLRDWGPQSDHKDVVDYRITRSRSCGSGVILTVDFKNGPQEKLWVERDDLSLGFSPLPGCPAPRR
jgi:hypothetical protein